MSSSHKDDVAGNRFDRQRTARSVAARHRRTAWDLAESGDLSGAIVEMDQALLALPDSAKHLTTKGHFQRENGDLEAARTTLERAVELDATYHNGWTELGRTYEALHWLEPAAVCYTKSAKIRPSAWVYTLLGNCQLHFAPEQALKTIEKALKIDPNWEDAIEVRRDALRALRSEEEEVDNNDVADEDGAHDKDR